jgi:hypothetical protein
MFFKDFASQEYLPLSFYLRFSNETLQDQSDWTLFVPARVYSGFGLESLGRISSSQNPSGVGQLSFLQGFSAVEICSQLLAIIVTVDHCGARVAFFGTDCILFCSFDTSILLTLGIAFCDLQSDFYLFRIIMIALSKMVSCSSHRFTY